jgi:hypothetical protein
VPRACSGTPPSASTEVAPAGGDTIGGLRGRARRQIADAGAALDPREATLLLCRVLDLGEATLLAHPERAIAGGDAARFL